MSNGQWNHTRNEPSLLRLVNLALGASALLAFLAAMGFGWLVPSRWLLAPWFTAEATATVPPWAVFITRIGVNLWLPAALLLLAFRVIGLHRGLRAPPNRWASITLALAWIMSIAFTAAKVFAGQGEHAGLILMVLGFYLAPVYLLVLAVGTIGAIVESLALLRFRDALPPPSMVALCGWAVLLVVLSFLPLLFAESRPLAASRKERTDFEASCQGVGVQFLNKPVAAVRSIAYDWDPSKPAARDKFGRYELAGDRITSMGGGSTPRQAENRKQLDFDFVESRRDSSRAGPASVNPNAPYYHSPAFRERKPYFGVDSLSADVLAYYESEPLPHGIRVTLTLSDRRSGAVLGIQKYVVDERNWRACGANIDDTISEQAFIYDAIHR